MDNSFKKENELLEKAIHFATERHSGAVRKGKTIPYILHPLETLQILASMKADANLMIAGVLHDTVEDTDTTLEEIIEHFGEDVGALVKSNSEDKSKSWEERKAHTIEYLKNAPRREKMLIMADKLANIRSLARDYLEVGDRLWERFNAPKEKQAWYYSGVQDSLFDMQSYDETSAAYWEFVAAFKDVFVGFFCDFDRERLYQICADGTGFYLQKGEPNWREIDHEISEDVVPLPRYKAESIEELWEMISESEGEDDGEYYA